MRYLIAIALLASGCSAPISQATPIPTSTITAPPTALASPSPTAVPTATPSSKLKLGESAGFAIAGDTGEVKITVVALDDQSKNGFVTPKPGMSYVSVVLRYDNGLSTPIQVSEFPWQLASADGVRHSTTLAARSDSLKSGSVVVPNGFLVGSITFEAPPGALDLYYVQQGGASRIAIWAVRP